MEPRRIYVPDILWDHGYFPILWRDDVWTNWPLPKARVYECITIGDIQYVLLRTSAFQCAPPMEGEQ